MHQHQTRLAGSPASHHGPGHSSRPNRFAINMALGRGISHGIEPRLLILRQAPVDRPIYFGF